MENTTGPNYYNKVAIKEGFIVVPILLGRLHTFRLYTIHFIEIQPTQINSVHSVDT